MGSTRGGCRIWYGNRSGSFRRSGRCQDARGQALHVSRGAWKEALPDARRRLRFGRAARQQERLEAWALHAGSDRPASGAAGFGTAIGPARSGDRVGDGERPSARRLRVSVGRPTDGLGDAASAFDRPLLRRVTLDFSVEVAEETNPLGTMIAKLSPGPGSCAASRAAPGEELLRRR